MVNSDHRNITSLKFTGGSCYIPKANKVRPLGEDAYFICEARNAIGVADGVGGWALEGVDAGKYARDLMENSEAALLGQKKGAISPERVMQLAYRKTRTKGSSTACIIALSEKNLLRYANLGDSGFILFRRGEFVYQSPVQHHRFNMPYQLGSGSNDNPNMAYGQEVKVEDGDIIVVGTDGLFDNVYCRDIEMILKRAEKEDVGKLAREIAEYALRNSKDRDYLSPFAKAAKKEGIEYTGGKYDDITVVVAKIERSS
ncbi:hypothetical protein M5689_015825 [Euphorbia peplus]|nr:hypothetical protein M5689_015825 [Euphorbia peplus]